MDWKSDNLPHQYTVKHIEFLDVGAEYPMKTKQRDFIKNTGCEHIPKCSPINVLSDF